MTPSSGVAAGAFALAVGLVLAAGRERAAHPAPTARERYVGQQARRLRVRPFPERVLDLRQPSR
ncbi:hypothetical protein [Streptomyces geranii]|uniref:hypothetical protein n=1 Tax=Streptomyces geranii TaxID=2058923 RepID=UPI000D02285F|nr:hypothetical protein [Streptomyces geranii]